MTQPTELTKTLVTSTLVVLVVTGLIVYGLATADVSGWRSSRIVWDIRYGKAAGMGESPGKRSAQPGFVRQASIRIGAWG